MNIAELKLDGTRTTRMVGGAGAVAEWSGSIWADHAYTGERAPCAGVEVVDTAVVSRRADGERCISPYTGRKDAEIRRYTTLFRSAANI